MTQRLVEFGHKGRDGFIRNIFIPPHKVDEFRTKYGNTDVYTTVMEFYDRSWTGPLAGPLVFDLDLAERDTITRPEGFAHIIGDVRKALSFIDVCLRVPKNLIICYFSGSRGFHIVVPSQIFGAPELPRLNLVYHAVARELVERTGIDTLDFCLYKRKALLRLAHSRHGATGLYKVPLLPSEVQNPRLDYAEVVRIASENRDVPYPAAETLAQASMLFRSYVERAGPAERASPVGRIGGPRIRRINRPCVARLLAEGVPRGRRNSALCIVVSTCRERGASFEATLEIARRFNREHCYPPDDDKKVRSTVRSIYFGGYSYGCASLQDLGFCIKEECPYYR